MPKMSELISFQCRPEKKKKKNLNGKSRRKSDYEPNERLLKKTKKN